MSTIRSRSLPATLLCAASLAVSASPVAAEDQAPALVTDRPDQTESAVSVPRGSIQLETGWTHAEHDADGVDSEIDRVPETLVRIGLTERIELRVGAAGYLRAEVAGASVDGLGDTALGLKVELFEEERGRRPKIALLAGTSLPTGDSEFSSERADPAFRVSLANSLTERLSLGYNVGMAWSSGPDANGERDTLSSLIWTASLGIGGTERLGFFVELFGETGISSDAGASTSVDGGLTFLIRPELQFDFFAGAGLSDAAFDWFGGVGLSYRFG